jgi:hypothetical protein
MGLPVQGDDLVAESTVFSTPLRFTPARNTVFLKEDRNEDLFIGARKISQKFQNQIRNEGLALDGTAWDEPYITFDFQVA